MGYSLDPLSLWALTKICKPLTTTIFIRSSGTLNKNIHILTGKTEDRQLKKWDQIILATETIFKNLN